MDNSVTTVSEHEEVKRVTSFVSKYSSNEHKNYVSMEYGIFSSLSCDVHLHGVLVIL